MKKLVVAALLLSVLNTAVFAGTFKPMIGYGTLLSPSLPDMSAVGHTETKGGLNYGIQYIFSEGKTSYGLEIASLNLYDYKYSQTYLSGFTLATAEVGASITSIPILCILYHDLSDSNEGFAPYFQGGLGLFMNTAKVKFTQTFIGRVESSTSSSDLGGFVGLGAKMSKLDIAAKYYFIQMDESATMFNLTAGINF
ncbi:MAG: hypothetical protein A2252_01675 [Elusimicrobia bacterium RIFOXYA2_FULL_39_19]|nr:MAG: hypothetical protein A2252_01675 [Elusimicrobia bacterium RIFOXYA2_FULL_39_19]